MKEHKNNNNNNTWLHVSKISEFEKYKIQLQLIIIIVQLKKSHEEFAVNSNLIKKIKKISNN